MAYIRFPDFTPSDNDLGSPRGHSNQLFIEVNKHIRALKDSVPNDGTNDGVEIVVHWTLGICPPSIVRFKHGKLQLQWTEHLDADSPKIVRSIAWQEANFAEIERLWGPLQERRDLLPHEKLQAEKAAARQAEADAKARR